MLNGDDGTVALAVLLRVAVLLETAPPLTLALALVAADGVLAGPAVGLETPAAEPEPDPAAAVGEEAAAGVVADCDPLGDAATGVESLEG